MVLLKKLLNSFALSSPAILAQEEGNGQPKELEVLLSLGVLKQDTFPQERWCPSCESESVTIQTIPKERAYTLCTRNAGAGRDYFDPQTLKQWRLNTPDLLSLFQKALGIQSPKITENIAGLLWDFGAQDISGANYHLYFCRNIDEIEKPKLSILTNLPHSAVFYTGTPHTQLPDNVLLVPILDLINSIKKTGIEIRDTSFEQFFPIGLYQTNRDDIVLDDNIAIQAEPPQILFEKIRGGHFKKQVAITPLAVRIISHLYQIRKNDEHAKKLSDLATALSETGSHSSISNQIKAVNKACSDNNITLILHQYDGKKWGLNARLGRLQ